MVFVSGRNELLAESEIPAGDPLGLFDRWYAEAREAEPNDSNAMALATATRCC